MCIYEIKFKDSDHKSEVTVLNSVSEVEVAKALGIGSVVSHETRPHSVAQHTESLGGVPHYSPATLGLPTCNIVQEVGHKNVSLTLAH